MISKVVAFFRAQWAAYNLPRPLFHLGEIVQLGNCYNLGHPWASEYYARVISREYAVDPRYLMGPKMWIYRVHLGRIDMSRLPIPEKFLQKV